MTGLVSFWEGRLGALMVGRKEWGGGLEMEMEMEMVWVEMCRADGWIEV